jgi:hypothetical protein
MTSFAEISPDEYDKEAFKASRRRRAVSNSATRER